MRRDAQMMDRRVERVPCRVEAVGEQLFDPRPAKPVRRQADGVHDDQRRQLAARPLIAIGNRHGGKGDFHGAAPGEPRAAARRTKQNGENESSFSPLILERQKSLELSTSTLARLRSTN